MKEKLGKNTKIIILVVCIMLTIIGVAYSYLAPLIKGVETESTISFNSGMIKITYNGSNVITGENIIPGWSETKEFTVVGSNNTSITEEDIMDYAIKLVVEENTFTDGAIRFELTGSSSNEEDTLSPLFGKVPKGTGETLLGTARFNQDDNIKNDVTHSYSLKIGFPNDENKNQNEDMNKSFKGYIVIEQGELQLTISKYISKLNMGENSLEKDEYGNIRYVGTTPNNYITFNNEIWRIIGVFDEGVKILRQERITDVDGNNKIAYDTASNNNWTTASLNVYLNTTYYKSLKEEAQSQIQEVTWHLGGWSTTEEVSAANMYKYERGIGKTNTVGEDYHVYNDNSTTWTGNIALMYASDYGYVNTNEYCRSNLSLDSTSAEAGLRFYCSSKNWIYISQINGTDTMNYNEYLLTHSTAKGLKMQFLILFDSNGIIYDGGGDYSSSSKFGVRPVVYLKSNIQIISGDGSKESPYQIELQS